MRAEDERLLTRNVARRSATAARGVRGGGAVRWASASREAASGAAIVLSCAVRRAEANTARLRHALDEDLRRNSSNRERNWLVVDATGKTLGRLATQIADALRGKRKPEYTPHVDTGDFVVVVNAEKIQVTGNKRADKRYYRHSGYPGGLRSRTSRRARRRPEEIIRLAVKGMLPRNRLAASSSPSSRSTPGPSTRTPRRSRNPMEIKS